MADIAVRERQPQFDGRFDLAIVESSTDYAPGVSDECGQLVCWYSADAPRGVYFPGSEIAPPLAADPTSVIPPDHPVGKLLPTLMADDTGAPPVYAGRVEVLALRDRQACDRYGVIVQLAFGFSDGCWRGKFWCLGAVADYAVRRDDAVLRHDYVLEPQRRLREPRSRVDALDPTVRAVETAIASAAGAFGKVRARLGAMEQRVGKLERSTVSWRLFRDAMTTVVDATADRLRELRDRVGTVERERGGTKS